MENELKTPTNAKTGKTILDCLKDLEHLLPKKECSGQKSAKHGKSSMIIGSPDQDRLPLNFVGRERGVTGCVKLKSGEEITHAIQIGTAGLPVAPQLTGQDWRLIDIEIQTEIYTEPRKFNVSEEGKNKLLPVLIQGKAAIRPAPFEYVITRLTRLKLLKPTQRMDETEVSSFLSDVAELLIEREFCYTAIDDGIKALLRQEKGEFFPTIERLEHYIYPIHFKMKRRYDKLHEVLSRSK